MVMGSATVTDSTRIVHHLEASVPVDDHPALVPCTSDTKVYQRHVYFVAMLDQVNDGYKFLYSKYVIKLSSTIK